MTTDKSNLGSRVADATIEAVSLVPKRHGPSLAPSYCAGGVGGACMRRPGYPFGAPLEAESSLGSRASTVSGERRDAITETR